MMDRRVAMDGERSSEGARTSVGSGWPRRAAGIVAAVAGLSIGAQIEVWMEPVPMTLQTLALMAGAGLLGPALGPAATALYVALGVAGVPVLADGGTLPLSEIPDSASTGYLVGFIVAATLAGLARNRLPARVLPIALLFAAAHLVVLGLGAAWLARDMGVATAVERGAVPYLLGGAVKSIAAAALVVGVRARRAAR